MSYNLSLYSNFFPIFPQKQMSFNAKNQLMELLQSLGSFEEEAVFSKMDAAPSGGHRSKVVVTFPDGREIKGIGEGQGRTDADIAAAQQVLNIIRTDHPDLMIDWEELKEEAQSGDTLIKLGVYTALNLNDAATKSLLLQELESDSHLAQVFDRLQVENDPDLAILGTNLGEKRKSTFIEALLWKRYKDRVFQPEARKALHELLDSLSLNQ